MSDSDTAEPLDITDDPRWQDGDFTIISSDKVRFKIPSHYLFAASSSWSRLAAGFISPTDWYKPETQRKVITMELEFNTSVTIGHFLSLVSGKTTLKAMFGDLKDVKAMRECHLLAKFLYKNYCQFALQAMKDYLELGVRKQAISLLHAFVIAALLESYSLCYLILDHLPPVSEDDVDQASSTARFATIKTPGCDRPFKVFAGPHLWDLSGALLDLCPLSYLGALMCALHKVKREGGSLSKEFMNVWYTHHQFRRPLANEGLPRAP